MATWTWTFLPIQQVLKNNGEIEFKTLTQKLMTLEPQRFRDIKTVEYSIDVYINCLDYNCESGKVKFNKNAGRYAKIGLYERSVQFALHESVKDMEKWQLYPLKTRSNSQSCYMNIPWEKIPRNKLDERGGIPYDENCDFRGKGDDSCKAGYVVSINILKKYKLIN